MHILLTNDDGIFAPGLRALSNAAREAGHRVTIFAPDGQRSAASHSITLDKPLRAERVEYEGIAAYAVNGTPADCARLGLFLLGNDRPDCVAAGVNRGANRGAATLYSGTVAAAAEGALCGVPGVAVSLCKFVDEGYEHAARLGVRLAEWALRHPLPIGLIYSLNVPLGAPRGVRAATLSHEYIARPAYREVPDGWMMADGEPLVPEEDENCDTLLTHAGYATLSILGWNLQAGAAMPDISELNEGY